MKEKRLYDLEEYLRNKKEIEKLKEKYQEIKTQAENIVQQYSSDPKPTNRTQDGSGLEKYVVRMIEITEKINQLDNINSNIIYSLNRIPFKYRYLLICHDINGESLGDISRRINKSYKYVITLHSKGLAKYRDLQKNT